MFFLLDYTNNLMMTDRGLETQMRLESPVFFFYPLASIHHLNNDEWGSTEGVKV